MNAKTSIDSSSLKCTRTGRDFSPNSSALTKEHGDPKNLIFDQVDLRPTSCYLDMAEGMPTRTATSKVAPCNILEISFARVCACAYGECVCECMCGH